MKQSCLKTTVIAVSLVAGNLMSACALSDGYIEKNPVRPKEVSAGVRVLPPALADNLRFSDSELALVLAVDKAGRIQAFARDGSRVQAVDFPLHADKIIRMETITTFGTTNPKTCWQSLGTTRCVFW
ncbi:MAG TPA: hypothetical protein ENJ80_10975 [Gammaproteobacteria bacterium]|nr:hypothetical protein [Gammaproteobacteria bacterium]